MKNVYWKTPGGAPVCGWRITITSSPAAMAKTGTWSKPPLAGWGNAKCMWSFGSTCMPAGLMLPSGVMLGTWAMSEGGKVNRASSGGGAGGLCAKIGGAAAASHNVVIKATQAPKNLTEIARNISASAVQDIVDAGPLLSSAFSLDRAPRMASVRAHPLQLLRSLWGSSWVGSKTPRPGRAAT